GTDLYRDIRTDSDARASLALADRLVVLQDMGRLELPVRFRRKTRVIYQSAEVHASREPPSRRFRLAVIGHLREEKDPFRAALALAHLADLPELEIVHLGEGLSPNMARKAQRLMSADRRYRWLGNVPHRTALGWLSRSDLLVLSSRMEGGANVICEAAAAGVPVVASRISGNVGMPGRGYPGTYRLASEAAAIDLAYAVPSQRAKVPRRRIPLVRVETVLRKLPVQPAHLGIARGLRQDGCRRDYPHFRVAVYDRPGRHRKHRAMRTIEQHLVGQDRKCLHRAPHGEQARLQDVQAVDFLDARPGDCPGQRSVLDEDREPLALPRAQDLGV